MLAVEFGNSTMIRTQVQLWYKWFKEGREDVNDDARPGCPSTSANEKDLESGKKIILNIESLLKRLLKILAYRSVHAKQFLWTF